MATYPIVIFSSTTFSKEDIRTATVTEEFQPLSITVPVGELELYLYSDDAQFSIIDPSGDFELLQYRQPLMLFEHIDGIDKFIGRYYLDTWENVSDNLIRLNCIDELGLLDTLTYRGGMWLTPITVSSLISQIFSSLAIEYEIDPDLAAVELTGWIPISTYREALQQIAFASGGYILCARQNGFIKFGRAEAAGAVTRGIVCGVPSTGESRLWKKRFRPSQWSGVMPVYDITNAEQSVNQKLSLRTQVTGVEISMHDITEGTAKRKLFEGILSIGTYEIRFSQPMHTLSIVGATITSSGANYAVLAVETEGSVLLEGLVYNDSITKYGVYLEDTTGIKENILTITEGSLVNSTNGATIAQRVFDYYQKRHVQDVRLIRPSAYVSTEVLVDTLYQKQISGIVEKMIIDLTGGFIAKTTIVGEPVEE